jgi:polyhydroxybutyrate depolymerase
MVESRHTIEVDGRGREYLVVAPDPVPSGLPLVLAFHGSNQNAEGFRRFSRGQFDELAADGTAVVAYPDGYGKHWNDARRSLRFSARTDGVDDVAFVRAMISRLAADRGIDERRVYAVGYSNGGQLVNRVLHEAPRLLAGAMMIAATQPAPENFLPAEGEIVPVPLLLMHGTRDPLVPYAGGMATLPFGLMPRGLGMSAVQTRDYFAARNGEVPVELITLEGGGHTVPGGRSGLFLGPVAAGPRAVDAFTGFFGDLA